MDTSPIVIDIGSGFCKTGFAGEESPRSVFPTIVGTPRHKGSFIGSQSQDSYVGNQAFSKIGILNIDYPVRSGFVMNWNELIQLLQYSFESELHTNSNEHPVLFSESIRSDKKQREKTVQVFFETFQVPLFSVCKQSFLSICSTGQKTGLSIDIGHETVQIVPVHDCQSLQSAATCLSFGGRELTNLFLKALKDRGFSLSDLTGSIIAQDIKEKLGYVALDYQSESEKYKSSHDVSYQSQDGDEFKVCDERFKCPELLFTPSLNDLEFSSIQDAANDSVKKCDAAIRKQLFENIVISGGSSMFEGLPERFEKELSQIVDKSTKLNIVAPKNRIYSTWIGGSMFASSSEFEGAAIKKADYDEKGYAIVSNLNF